MERCVSTVRSLRNSSAAISRLVFPEATSRAIALLSGNWRLTGHGPDGDITMWGTFANIGRRQPDGTCLYLLDNPEVAA